MKLGSWGRQSTDVIKYPDDFCFPMLLSLACRFDLMATRWLLCLQVSYLYSTQNKRRNLNGQICSKILCLVLFA